MKSFSKGGDWAGDVFGFARSLEERAVDGAAAFFLESAFWQ